MQYDSNHHNIEQVAQLLFVVEQRPVVALRLQELFEGVEHGCWRVVYYDIECNGRRVDDEFEPDVDADEYAGCCHCHNYGESIVLLDWG